MSCSGGSITRAGVGDPSQEQEWGSIAGAGVEDPSQELEWKINHRNRSGDPLQKQE